MLNPSPYKISYDEGEEVTVYCIDGYYPSHERTRCDQPLTPQEWTPAITCTDITVSERVASTSASFWMSCSSECPHHWRFDVECCDVLYGLCQTMNTDGHVTFTGLQPSSEYQVSITLHNNQKQYKLKPRLIRTKHSVYRYFDVRFPTKQDWTGPANITSFQIIISARRIYDQSFVRDETFWAPHNGTEYKVLLQHGANHTITLQGITVVGFETIKEWNIETDIGDPPHHPPNTLGTNSTLKLYPVSPLNGPISSYDIIVYVDQVMNMSVDCPGFTNTPYNSSLAQSSYTAAVLPAETLTGSRTFILGDNQYYNGFHNAPLTPNHNYNVYIRVSSSWKEVQKSSCSLAGVI
ncbi:sushi domain-containing protein 1-like [Pyxicephalus adspersus]|uniref:sushi domain-containing protein 1-like n=1 Tax=Pyxicephalus adspersus TaxID=30357 RepID=UPI003B5CD807